MQTLAKSQVKLTKDREGHLAFDVRAKSKQEAKAMQCAMALLEALENLMNYNEDKMSESEAMDHALDNHEIEECVLCSAKSEIKKARGEA